jgi:hypothetical protein
VRAYIGTRLFRIAGHTVYGGVSGQLSPFVSVMFLLGMLLPFLLARLLVR